MLYSGKTAEARPGRLAGTDSTGQEPRMRVEVDYDACEANAVCAGLVPEVFEVDDDDNLYILVDEVPGQLIEGVRHAVRSCPKAALRLIE
jgi:ferredoxin